VTFEYKRSVLLLTGKLSASYFLFVNPASTGSVTPVT
jgi:hypothetical protein